MSIIVVLLWNFGMLQYQYTALHWYTVVLLIPFPFLWISHLLSPAFKLKKNVRTLVTVILLKFLYFIHILKLRVFWDVTPHETKL